MPADRPHGRDEVERRAQGPCGIVLPRHGEAETCEETVPLVLGQAAALARHRRGRRLPIGEQEGAQVLGVEAGGEGAGFDEVREEDGDGASLPRLGDESLGGGAESLAAGAAEPHARGIGEAAGGAGGGGLERTQAGSFRQCSRGVTEITATQRPPLLAFPGTGRNDAALRRSDRPARR